MKLGLAILHKQKKLEISVNFTAKKELMKLTLNTLMVRMSAATT